MPKRAWILACFVALSACGSSQASDGASSGGGAPGASGPGSSTEPGSGSSSGASGGTTTDPPASWTPPSTNGPPATCTKAAKTFGGLAMIECVPQGGEGKSGKPAPLVVALHGYTQSAEQYRDTTEWHVLAGRYGFYVIYPSAPGSRSWTWFSGDRARGTGDGAAIVAMVDQMKESHDIRSDMVFVTGLSAGGYQTLVMLADYPDVFAAGAAVAGGPYGCSTGCMTAPQGDGAAVKAAMPDFWNDPSKRKPRLLAIQGSKDNIVSPANLQATVDQWIAATGADASPANAALGAPDELKGFPYKAYGKAGQIEVASLSITGMAHATPIDPGTGPDQGGKAGSYAAAVGLYSPYQIAKFFKVIP